MAQMPQLVIAGTYFALTGRMWTERKHIEGMIIGKGGIVSTKMYRGCVLVMASAQLYRGDDNKWHTHGTATTKAKAAMKLGAMVYHEKMLMDALKSPDGRSDALRIGAVIADQDRTPRQAQKVAALRDPEWNDEMHTTMMANMAKASELLGSFQDN